MTVCFKYPLLKWSSLHWLLNCLLLFQSYSNSLTDIINRLWCHVRFIYSNNTISRLNTSTSNSHFFASPTIHLDIKAMIIASTRNIDPASPEFDANASLMPLKFGRKSFAKNRFNAVRWSPTTVPTVSPHVINQCDVIGRKSHQHFGKNRQICCHSA